MLACRISLSSAGYQWQLSPGVARFPRVSLICIKAWRPYRKKDIDMLERVQRRATKTIPKLRNISYEMRLKECGLTTLETRRLRGDQIEVF